MSGDRTIREFERYCKATIASGAVPLIVGFLAVIASLCKGSFSLEVWGTAVEFVVIGVIPCAVAGFVGASVGRSGRAGAYGAIMLACVAAEYLWFNGWRLWPIGTNVWLIVFVSGVGALTAGAGAVIGRTVPATGDETRSLRLSLRELAVAGLLTAILLGCILGIV